VVPAFVPQLQAISFDCYGTIIDWERGIVDAIAPLLRRHKCPKEPEEILSLYAHLELAAEAGPFKPYTTVLQDVVDGLGAELGFSPSESERRTIVDSLPRWPPFSDSVPALRSLGSKWAVAVVSNVDDDLFAGTCRRIGWSPNLVVTAQSVGRYKPDPAMFTTALRRLELEPSQVLHVGCSPFHDIAPASAAGMHTCVVERRAGRSGGATPPSGAKAELTVRDLAELVRTLGLPPLR